MASKPAIRVSGLSKEYRIYRSPRDLLMERLTGRNRHQVHKALSNIDLEVAPGEVVGIMGPNGAGKSTLLKIITGTLPPTTGTVEINGRVSAILELGTGFAPHNTGRENIAMGCLVLGMSPEEIAAKTPGIIAFSELGDVIDRPFHTYSTGMQARLTFSVAISPDPEVLIIDEALAVGDARFQQKCFGRIRDMKRNGTSILLVSHDDNTIAIFCERAMILMGGEIAAQGASAEVVPLYHRLLFGTPKGEAAAPAPVAAAPVAAAPVAAAPVVPPSINEPDKVANLESAAPAKDPHSPARVTDDKVELPSALSANAVPIIKRFKIGDFIEPCYPTHENRNLFVHPPSPTAQVYGNANAAIVDYGLLDENGVRVTELRSGDRCHFYFVMQALRDLETYTLGAVIRDRRATILWGITNLTQNSEPPPLRAGECVTTSTELCMWLSDGEYSFAFGSAVRTSGEKNIFVEGAPGFRVRGPGGIFTTSVVNLQQRFEVQTLGGLLPRGAPKMMSHS